MEIHAERRLLFHEVQENNMPAKAKDNVGVTSGTRIEAQAGDVRLVLELPGIREISDEARHKLEEALLDDFYIAGKISEVLQDLELVEFVPKVLVTK